jgi:hypothetical protein
LQIEVEENLLACPFFMPTQKSENAMWIHPSRLPLGAGWDGDCTAHGIAATIPAGDQLAHCNLGYASDCPRLPKERKWDAVRFAVASEHESRVCLAYVCERNHLPSEHGRLEYNLLLSRWLSSHTDPRIQKMAECFLDSWLAKSRRGVDAETAADHAKEIAETVHERN